MGKIKTVLFILFISFIVYSESISQIHWDYSYQDKISIEIYPEKLTSDFKDSLLTISIINNSNDTLITLNEIIMLGFANWAVPYPSLSYSLPNIIIFNSDDFPVTFGYGRFDINYDTLPNFIVLEPNNKKTFKINLKRYEKHLKNKTWEFEKFFVFANKSTLDKIIKCNYSYEVYLQSLNFSDTIVLKVNDSPEIENNEKQNFNLIKDTFRIIILK